MPCYIITHRIVGQFSQEAMNDCAHKLIAAMPREAKWDRSWYLPNEDALICHWDTPDLDLVIQAMAASGVRDLLPIEKVQEAVEVHPEWYGKRRRGRPRKLVPVIS